MKCSAKNASNCGLIIVLFFMLTSLASAQPAAETADGSLNEIIKRTELVDDILFVHDRIEQDYAYPELNGLDYPAYLEHLINTNGQGITKGALAREIQKVIMMLGDPNAQVADFNSYLKPGFLPFYIVPFQNSIVCLNADGSGFLHPEYPFLESVNGIMVDVLLQNAGMYVPNASQQFQWTRAVGKMRYIRHILAELDVREGSNLKIELNDGRREKLTLDMPISDELLSWQKNVNTDILQEQKIAYLRIPQMYTEKSDREKLSRELESKLDSDGLIIDIRGNTGGSREVLHMLAGHFIPQDFPAIIFDAAVKRINRAEGTHTDGYLAEDKMFPVSAGTFGDADMAILKKFKRKFYPEWEFDSNLYSDWHYSVLRPDSKRKQYENPVVVLIDAGTSNEADAFAEAFKTLPHVTLVGQTTAGGSERAETYLLKESGIQVQLPAVATFQANGLLYVRHGVTPDIYQDMSLNDFTGESDAQVQAAVKAIQSRNSRR